MKSVFSIFICLLTVAAVFAQTPEKVYRITQEYYSNEWYKTQSDLWKKVIEKDPQNAAAWESYYYANRYARFEEIDSKERQVKLAKIIEEMGQAIPDSYEYTLLKAWNSHDIMDISGYEKAYKMNPDRPDPLYNMASYYEIRSKPERVHELYEKIYDSHDIVPELVEYNYNVLMSVEENGILYTNGDNDTYPARMLQEVKNIRPDVTLINASMAGIDSYLDVRLKSRDIDIDVAEMRKTVKKEEGEYNHAKFLQLLFKTIDEKYPDVPQYFALTMSHFYVGDIEDDLQITGLANRYSSSPFDNIALLKKNVEQDFRTDYLDHHWYRENYVGVNMMSHMNANYVAAFLKLAQHYKLAGETNKFESLRNLSLRIAKKGGDKQLLKYIEEL